MSVNFLILVLSPKLSSGVGDQPTIVVAAIDRRALARDFPVAKLLSVSKTDFLAEAAAGA